jgi:hypothetical protein
LICRFSATPSKFAFWWISKNNFNCICIGKRPGKNNTTLKEIKVGRLTPSDFKAY